MLKLLKSEVISLAEEEKKVPVLTELVYHHKVAVIPRNVFEILGGIGRRGSVEECTGSNWEILGGMLGGLKAQHKEQL